MTPTNDQLGHNLLVVSDLHLGEDLRPGGAALSYFRHLARLERELEDFLRHHTERRLDGRPWRLVINGDMVDFMSMKILPDEPGVDAGSSSATSSDSYSDEDRLYGLGFSERAAQKKLERAMLRHQGVFRAFGDFVRAGNDLYVIVGNHDVEFHYEQVQRTFVEWLCGLSVGVGGEPEERAAFAARIQFCPWFYYQENCIYIEHGHQFDEYCSFDYQLQPAPRPEDTADDIVDEAHYGASDDAPAAGEPAGAARTGSAKLRVRRRHGKSRFALSMAHSGMRYFANQLPEYDPHTAEHWGFVNYMRWLWTMGLSGLTRVSYLYGLLVWKVVEAWYWMRGADGERKQVHFDRLRALSRTWRIAEDKLLALQALHRVPVTRRFIGVLRALFIDRVLLSGMAVGAALGLVLSLEGHARLWAPVTVLGLSLVAHDLLGRQRLASSAERLRAVPRMVQALVGAPLIVFGHSHAPERVALPGGAVYFNTGTWASEDVRMAFTHLVVRAGDVGDPRAELRQWRDGESAPFEPPWPPSVGTTRKPT